MNKVYRVCLIMVLLWGGASLSGCRGRGYRPLIPTPVLYTDLEINPFDHIPPEYQTVEVDVFYATNRQPKEKDAEIHYGNGMDNRLHVGQGIIRLGDEEMTWEGLVAASTVEEREEPVPVTLTNVDAYGVLSQSMDETVQDTEDVVWGDAEFAAAINAELGKAEEKIIKIYIHGFKVGFDHGLTLGGQLRHFAMRDGVTVAFDWASRQSKLLYLSDIKRAQASIPDLVALLEFLGRETTAERINIISWSAGAPIHSAAMVTLRERHPELSHDALYQKYKINEVIFAASDIDFRAFVDEFRRFYDLPKRILITLCYDDKALDISRWIHGGSRLGSADASELLEAELEEIQKLYSDKTDVVDVTRSKNVLQAQMSQALAAFSGHHYWFDNSWINSDLLVSVYLDLLPADRGLTLEEDTENTWYFSEDYPQKVVELLRLNPKLKDIEEDN